MIQVIQRSPSALEMFSTGLSQGIEKGLDNYYDQKKEQRKLELKRQAQQSALEHFFPEFAPEIGMETPNGRAVPDMMEAPATTPALSESREGSSVLQHMRQLSKPPEAGQSVTRSITEVPFERRLHAAVASGAIDQPTAMLLQRQYLASPEYSARVAAAKSEAEAGQKFVDRLDLERDALPMQQFDIRRMEEAVRERGAGGLILDTLGEELSRWHVPGAEALTTAKGAQLKSAIKDFLIRDIRQVTGRPNMWIEQQISSALPSVGKRQEANMRLIEGLKFKSDLAEKRLEIGDALASQLKQQLGYVPRNISKLVDQQMRPWIAQREQKLAYNLRRLYEQEHPPTKKSLSDKVSPGTPLTWEMATFMVDNVPGDTEQQRKQNAKKVAIGLGYTLVGPEIYETTQ
jgi:hypothetical protein